MNIIGQNKLFNDKYISTISFDEQEIIRNILFLHSPNKLIDCDPTYSKGNFYKKGLPRPKYIFDKFPQTSDTVEAESHSLPLEDESIGTLMFDPPFIMGVGSAKENAKPYGGITGSRFTSFKNFGALKDMYSKSLREFHRVLSLGGAVIFKCQDVVSGGQQYFTHCWLMKEAVEIGFYPKDLFILLAKNRINDGRKQQHARKYHCYYWVFKKQKCKIDYEFKL